MPDLDPDRAEVGQQLGGPDVNFGRLQQLLLPAQFQRQGIGDDITDQAQGNIAHDQFLKGVTDGGVV